MVQLHLLTFFYAVGTIASAAAITPLTIEQTSTGMLKLDSVDQCDDGWFLCPAPSNRCCNLNGDGTGECCAGTRRKPSQRLPINELTCSPRGQLCRLLYRTVSLPMAGEERLFILTAEGRFPRCCVIAGVVRCCKA
jgi:hypothetical protein